MRHKYLIFAIFCLVLLCLVPMVSAIELSALEKTQGKKTNSQSEKIIFHRIGALITTGTLPKHPLLLLIVEIQLALRFLRAVFLELFSVVEIPEAPDQIVHPLLYLYSLWLMTTFIIEGTVWAKISSSLGWNWPPFPYGSTSSGERPVAFFPTKTVSL